MRRALTDLRRVWPQLILTDLLSRALLLVLSGPVVGAALLLFLAREKDEVVTDVEIATYLLRPLGMAALVILGGLALGVYFARLGLAMVIGCGASIGRRVTYVDAFRYVLARGTGFVQLGGHLLARLALAAAPALALIGGAYALFLSEHDINYYLAERPPEFRRALTVAGAVLAVLAVFLVRLIASWIVALPAFLFEGVRGHAALRASRDATRGYTWRIACFLACWIGGTALVASLVSFAIGRVGGLLIPGWDQGWIPAAIGLASTLALAGLASVAVQMLTDALLPLLILSGYRGLGRKPNATSLEHLERLPPLGERPSFQVPRKALVVTLFVLPAVVAAAVHWVVQDIGAEDDAEIIAHRGASAVAPENTMAAFRAAEEAGADWIELDVQENADGEVVVAHDSDFMRASGSSIKVWNATDEDLAQLDIGSWFDPAFAGEHVPSLREVLEWAQGRIGIVIELKYYGHDERLEARVAELVEATGMEREIMVMSLDRGGLARMGELRPDWTRGLLNTASVGDLTRLDVDFLALNSAAATHAQIRRAHARGRQVYVWTVNDPIQMSVLLSRGVDGLITDEPALARRVLELRADLSPLGRIIVWAAGEAGFLRQMADASGDTDA